jgi:glycosyltransferase involved in cell wall biosynthesis
MFLKFLDWTIAKVLPRVASRLAARRLAKGRPRSLWGVTPLLTLPLKARADRALGFDSRSLVFKTYYITQEFDYNLRLAYELTSKLGSRGIQMFERVLLIWAVSRFDVFHFFYDRGLTDPILFFGVRPWELDLLRANGKRVYFYAYGADVRRREPTLRLGKWNFCSDCPEPGTFCACSEDYAPVMAEMAAKATAAIALGDMLTYVPNARNMHYWPIDAKRVPAASPPRIDGPLRIAHAPNHTHFKGSSYLEAMIDKLRGEGHEIEYVKVQGVPNSDVIRLFGNADIVADQFIGGAYGYTALEAMARGKPVLTYVRSSDLVEAVDECPLLNTTPDNLEDVLRWCLANRERLPAIGAQGTAYVHRWHTVDAVAERLARLYLETADFPEETRRIISKRRATIETELRATKQVCDWEHPFIVARGDPSDKFQSSRTIIADRREN